MKSIVNWLEPKQNPTLLWEFRGIKKWIVANKKKSSYHFENESKRIF
jgi:hypothetical protein